MRVHRSRSATDSLEEIRPLLRAHIACVVGRVTTLARALNAYEAKNKRRKP
jgi:hypothetical protein